MRTLFAANPEAEYSANTTEYTWRPAVEEASLNGNRVTELRAKQFAERKVYLLGEVTDTMADDFVSEMLYLCKSMQPIDIYLNSPGGSVASGLCIYSTIRAAIEKGIEVNIYVTSLAASMGAIILAAGEKGHRFMLPYAKTMIHEPLISGGIGGSATSIANTAESILATKATLAGILAERTGNSLEEVNKSISFDNFMSASETIKYGLADEIRNII